MIDPSVIQKVGNEPRLLLIQSYLSKSYKKNATQNETAYLKQKGMKYFFKQFDSDPEKGLFDENVLKNEQKYGKNEYKKKKLRSFWKILFEALSDEMLIILMVAAVISIIVEFFFSEQKKTFWLQGVSILLAVAVVSIVASVNDYQKQKQFQELNKIQENTNKFKAIRNGSKVDVHKNDIVVGDIILVEGGYELPADGLVVTAEQAILDEGSITGEAIQKYKCSLEDCDNKMSEESPTPILISGTSIKSGFIKMIVLVVGKQSTAGQLNEQIFAQENQDKTPLEVKLDFLVEKIGRLGVYSALIVFFALVLRLLISDIIPDGWKAQYLGEILKYLILGVSIVVVAIPEGLPLAVTLALAYSVRQMLQEKNLVRKLASCETMGGAHVICTDKTGTLTKNQMFVVQIWNGNKLLDEKSFNSYLQSINELDRNLALNSLILNSKAVLEPKAQGSSTEVALLKFCKSINETFFNKNLKVREKRILASIPFSSDRKRMTSLIEENGKKYLLQKGGVEIVLEACDKMYNNGNVQKLNKKTIQHNIQKMAKKGHRVIALAYKQVNDPNIISQMKSNSPKTQNNAKHKDNKSNRVLQIQKSGFILQMLIGIQDLPREETKRAIQDCHRGRVVVIMVTGDNKLTARAIADQVGITNPGDDKPGLVRDGHEIDQIADEKDPLKIEKYLKNLKVMARSRPEHKYKLVECIKRLNNVTAVTGDGTNDAPALMKADVGFSMGVKGTQIAKSASDIIIMNDNFNSIVRALIWGRNIYESIRKFLQFQLTVNIVACLMSVISSVIIRQSVLTALQMLWVNMIMDSLASLALATEPPNGDELLDRKPFQKKQPLITKTMMKHIIGQTVYQIVVLMMLLFFAPNFIPEYRDQFDALLNRNDLEAKYFLGHAEGSIANGMFYTLSGDDNYITYYNKYHVYSRHMTFLFTTFVMLQFFNFFNCRRIRDEYNILSHPCSNILYWVIVVMIFVLQWVIVTFLSVFFKLYNFGGLTKEQWLLSIFIGATCLLVSQILRWLPFGKPKDSETTEVLEQQLQIRYHKSKHDDSQEQSQQQDQDGQIHT